MLRVLHTADWHLGHSLHELPRTFEHERFLGWLVDTAVREEIDALVIAGDVFDAANPPAAALEAWYRFLAALARRAPGVDVVVIGGNHDSAARLDAPEAILAGLGVRVVGGLPRRGGELDLDRLIVPLRDRGGAVRGHAAAVPYLRPADLPAAPGDGDPLIEGVRAIYREVLEEARRRGGAVLALGHLYMVGTELSLLSERRILGGNQHALPASIFPGDVAYAALGHLHKAQRVGGHEHVRYSGSPIPLSMGEAGYRHQVVIAEVEGDGPARARAIPVPRAVELLRVPRRGGAPLEEVEAALAALEPLGDPRDPARPYLEVCVALDRPVPDLRRRIEEAAAGRRPRLCKIGVEYTGDGAPLAEAAPAERLAELDPGEVFVRRWRRDHEGEPPAALVEAFFELLEEARAP